MRRLAYILPAVLILGLYSTASATAQSPAASVPAADPWAALRFLIGSWEATTGAGSADAKVTGVYSFSLDLKDHIMTRISGDASCKALADFDCDHTDHLYLYPEGTGIRAIYFDSEGHVIHYEVTTASAATAVFLSDPSLPGPQFRLIYERKGSVLSGKFQVRPPGQNGFQSYLEWSGGKR